MTETDLRALLPFLYDHRVQGQSDARIDALSRMYLAVDDLLCITSLYDYAARRKIGRKIDAFYRVIDRTSVKGLCRMYRLAKESTWAVYGEKDEECSELYYRFVGDYLANPDPGQEQDVLRCIAYEWGNIADDTTESDCCSFYRAKGEQWVEELDADGCWQSLSQEKAVRRIESLQHYYYAFRDDRFNDAILRAYDYYKKRLALPAGIASERLLPLLGAWYDLSRVPGVFPYDQNLPKRIAGLMGDFANTVKPRSDAWYFAMGYAVVQCCSDILDSVQREMIQEAG